MSNAANEFLESNLERDGLSDGLLILKSVLVHLNRYVPQSNYPDPRLYSTPRSLIRLIRAEMGERSTLTLLCERELLKFESHYAAIRR